MWTYTTDSMDFVTASTGLISPYWMGLPIRYIQNILNRDFNTTGPNQKWCTDVTEVKIPTTGEKLFISPMIDLYDRFPVSLEISDKNDALLAD